MADGRLVGTIAILKPVRDRVARLAHMHLPDGEKSRLAAGGAGIVRERDRCFTRRLGHDSSVFRRLFLHPQYRGRPRDLLLDLVEVDLGGHQAYAGLDRDFLGRGEQSGRGIVDQQGGPENVRLPLRRTRSRDPCPGRVAPEPSRQSGPFHELVEVEHGVADFVGHGEARVAVPHEGIVSDLSGNSDENSGVIVGRQAGVPRQLVVCDEFELERFPPPNGPDLGCRLKRNRIDPVEVGPTEGLADLAGEVADFGIFEWIDCVVVGGHR